MALLPRASFYVRQRAHTHTLLQAAVPTDTHIYAHTNIHTHISLHTLYRPACLLPMLLFLLYQHFLSIGYEPPLPLWGAMRTQYCCTNRLACITRLLCVLRIVYVHAPNHFPYWAGIHTNASIHLHPLILCTHRPAYSLYSSVSCLVAWPLGGCTMTGLISCVRLQNCSQDVW
jgi:hypothetical protein